MERVIREGCTHLQNRVRIDMLLRFFRILVSRRQFMVDHILTVRSSPIVARYDPTGSHATPFTKLVWAVRTAITEPSTTSQMTTSVSRLHEARQLLSGDHARPVTPSLCRLQATFSSGWWRCTDYSRGAAAVTHLNVRTIFQFSILGPSSLVPKVRRACPVDLLYRSTL